MLFLAGYAAAALIVFWFFGNRMDEGALALILFGLVPVVMFAWIHDALFRGEMWRQGPRSLTASSTMNEQRISRGKDPVKFWLMILLTAVFAIAIAAFVVAGLLIKYSF